MIYPKKNKAVRWLFHQYIIRLVQRGYRRINFNSIAVDDTRSVLLIANHFSWWDGFLLYYVNHKLFKKQFHVMVVEETVKNVSFFKYMGAFSVSRHSRETLASVRYAAELLNNPDNLVLIFPQGKLYTNFADLIHFEKGVIKIMAGTKNPFQTVFAASFMECMQYKKPSVNVYLSNLAKGTVYKNINELQQAYQQHYSSAKMLQNETVI